MFTCLSSCPSVPCCPEGVSVSLVSTDTLEIMWTASRGAELYQTRAADRSEVILCNDTAPVCALSGLSCDSPYSVVVTPCNEISGCNRACKAHTKETGRERTRTNTTNLNVSTKKNKTTLGRGDVHGLHGRTLLGPELWTCASCHSLFLLPCQLPACRQVYNSIRQMVPASVSAGQRTTAPPLTL